MTRRAGPCDPLRSFLCLSLGRMEQSRMPRPMFERAAKYPSRIRPLPFVIPVSLSVTAARDRWRCQPDEMQRKAGHQINLFLTVSLVSSSAGKAIELRGHSVVPRCGGIQGGEGSRRCNAPDRGPDCRQDTLPQGERVAPLSVSMSGSVIAEISLPFDSLRGRSQGFSSHRSHPRHPSPQT